MPVLYLLPNKSVPVKAYFSIDNHLRFQFLVGPSSFSQVRSCILKVREFEIPFVKKAPNPFGFFPESHVQNQIKVLPREQIDITLQINDPENGYITFDGEISLHYEWIKT